MRLYSSRTVLALKREKQYIIRKWRKIYSECMFCYGKKVHAVNYHVLAAVKSYKNVRENVRNVISTEILHKINAS